MRPIRDIFRDYAVFDAEGRHINGMDKQSNHSYGDAYEGIIQSQFGFGCDSRNCARLVMEIGIADGSCLLAWREIFPNAHIVGLDIHEPARLLGQHYGQRLEFHYGDQRDKDDCRRAAAGRQFDFIVEDATHHLANTLLTLYWMWPFVAPGGLYIVEEWEGASGEREQIKALWPNVEIVGTCGPHIQDEPLIVFRKPR